jgi:hypothetical protein
MEGSGRRLAWIAIALSALALFVAVSGHAQSRWQAVYVPQGNYGPPAGFAQPGAPGPQGNFGPQNNFGPQQQPGPQGNFGPQNNFGPQQQPPLRGDRRFGPGEDKRDRFGGPRRPGPGFFILPFIIGGLIKLALAGLLIFLGLKFLRGRRGPGGTPPSNPPGPEQPPYTGETQQM